MAIRRDIRGRFVSRSASQGGTYSVKDSAGRTQYFGDGQRISGADWRAAQGLARENRAEARERSREQAQRLGIEYENVSHFRDYGVPDADTGLEAHGAEVGDHIKDMGTYTLSEAADLDVVRDQIASDPALNVDPDDVIIAGIELNDLGQYEVYYLIDWSSYYDDSE